MSCEKKDLEPQLGSIYGIVTDKATGDPINNAGVELLPNSIKAITGSDGSFQFDNIEEGKYQLYITKSGYQNFTTNEIIVKANSKDITHSIQLEKLPPALHITDDAGNDIDTINFGSVEGDIMRSFNIFNNSEESLEWEIAHSSVWIKSFSKEQGVLKAGATQTIVLTIDRSQIISGEVSTIAHIVSDNGSKELTILASASAVVETIEATDIESTSAILSANLLQNMEPSIVEYGFVYNKEAMPTLNNGAFKVFRTGIPQIGKYSIRVDSLIPETKYHVCAYVSNGEKVVYGSQIDFTTIAHHPSINIKEINATASSFTIEYEVFDGGAQLEEVGICWDTKSFPTKESNYLNTGHEAKQYTNIISGLSVSTTYYVRVYARNIEEEVYSTEMIVNTSDGLPKVETSNEFSTTASTITAGGNITSNGGFAITDRGVCYSTTNAQPTLTDGNVSSGKGDGAYQASITGLSAGTNYYVRAYATNEIGTSYGKAISIQTKSGNASVLLSNATNITALTASASVTVSDAGSATLQSCGICWSTNPMPTIADSKTVAAGKALNTAYPCNMSELQPGTTYYVRAYATTDVATTYSEQKSFTTKTGLAETTLGAISNITALTASSTVTITNAGGATIQSCGICWSTNPNPTITDSKTVATGKTLNTAYPCNMSELQPGTTYYVRAYATTNIATTYSEQKSFITKTGLPVLSTGNATPTATSFSCLGEVSDNGGYAVTERGICYSLIHSEPTILDTKVTSGSGNGTFSASVTELSPSTSYYVRAYATNSIGTAYGEVIIVTTKDGVALVTLGAFANITALTATGQVTVTNAGGATLQSCGICWSTTPNPTTANQKTVASGKVLNTAYTCNMSNLNPSTLYYVRAYATTDLATSYSTQKTFTTASGLPVLTTTQPTATSVNITSGGNITSDGGYPIIARGVCYSMSNSEPTLNDAYTTSGTGSGSFNSVITNVSVSTSYYVRAYATNSIGTNYGDTYIVTTDNGLPSVTTTIIGENVTSTTAVGGGNVTDDGGYTVTERGVCWSTLPNPTTTDSKTVDGGGKGYFSSTITGIDLTGSNIYYVRAYATNANGTVYGKSVKISKENLDYANLPTIQYAGYTYKLYPDMGIMTWDNAMSACDGLSYGGYDDWYLPSPDEIQACYLATKDMEGWKTNVVNNQSPYYIEVKGQYWTSEEYGSYGAVTFNIVTRQNSGEAQQKYTEMDQFSKDSSQRVRAVRKYIAQ